MPKLPVISGTDALKVFSRAGWSPERQVGSHIILRKPGSPVTLSVPLHHELKKGLLRKLMRDAGLSVEEFAALR